MNQSFSNCHVITHFDKPLTADEIKFISHPLSFREQDMSALRENWLQQLETKKQLLAGKGISSFIKEYKQGNENDVALYTEGKAVMWPGKCITLTDYSYTKSMLLITVSEISYPFIAALSDPEFQNKISDSPLMRLRPPLAICTFAITKDNYLILTIRGQQTNVYPGRFYGQGGNPTSASFNLINHQLEEMKDELLLSVDDVDIDSFRFLGLVEDAEMFPRKPDLIGTVNLKVSKEQVEKIFYQRDAKERPADVADIYFQPLKEDLLNNFLNKEYGPKHFCPPAYGGLFLAEKFFQG